MPATKDGRCWACVQRRRWYSESVTQIDKDGLRHAALDDVPLCELPRRGRSARPEAMREYRRRYVEKQQAADPEGWHAKRLDQQRRHSRRKRYGLTPEQHDSMMSAQNDLCAICRAAPATDVDHCHETGRVRGLLCGPCNRMMGQANDDPERLEAAARYLRES